MVVVLSKSSEEAKEKNRWESTHSLYLDPEQGDVPPGRPYGSMCDLSVRQPDGSVKTTRVKVGDVWPRMMYKARRTRDGILVCVDNSTPELESWSKQNYKPCENESAHMVMLEQGWRDTQGEAIALVHAKENGESTIAAHRAFEDRNMSDRAKAEIAAVEATTPFHVPAKDESPKKRKSAWATRVEKYGPTGRPAKVT